MKNIVVREEELSAIAEVIMKSPGMDNERKLITRMFRRNKYSLFKTSNSDSSKDRYHAADCTLNEFVRRKK